MDMVLEALGWFFNILYYAIFIRCILSWFPINRNNGFYQLLYNLTEPIMKPVRELMRRSPIGASMNYIDFSPVIVCLLLSGARSVIMTFLLAI